MYSLSDPTVLLGLSRCVSAFAKIGDMLSIDATPDKLELSCVNASRTVVARAAFPRAACFAGPGARRAIQVKARAAEVVFARADQERCVLHFGRLHNNVEVLEVLLESPSLGVTKVCRLPCLAVYEPVPETEDLATLPYFFSAGLDFFKEILSNCMPAAEEAEFRFLSHRGFTFRAFRDKSRTDQSKVRAGVDTSIENEFRRFDRLQVLSPWASTTRLKELRTYVLLCEQLFPMNPVDACFKRPGDPLIFETQHPVTALAVMMRFTTKPHRSALDNTSSVMVRIGDQTPRHIAQLVSYGRPQSFMQRAAPQRVRAVTSSGPAFAGEPAPETAPEPELVADPTEAAPAPAAPIESETPSLPPSPIFVGYADDDEIGMTQAASQAVGLFDPPRKVRRRD